MYWQNKGVQQVANVNRNLAAKIVEQGTFITDEDIPLLIAINRHMIVLVRCGNGRFLCPVQDVTHFIGIIEEHSKLKEAKEGKPLQGDHVRDVSFPA